MSDDPTNRRNQIITIVILVVLIGVPVVLHLFGDFFGDLPFLRSQQYEWPF